MALLRRRDRPPLRVAAPAALLQFLRDGPAALTASSPNRSP